MESFVITWRELLIGAVLVLAVYIAEMLLLMRSAKPRGWRVWQKGAEAHVKSRELQSLEMDLARLNEQVAKLQAEIEQFKTQQVVVTPYTHAIQMAQQGLDAGELSASCGISRGEAELIIALHRNQPS